MVAEVFTDGNNYEGRHCFPVLPAVGDRVSIHIRDTDSWNTFRVVERDLHGYRDELPVVPRVILYLGKV